MRNSNTRRTFLKTAGMGLLAAPLASSVISCGTTNKTARSQHESISANKSIPDLSLNVRSFGASGDGKKKDTKAIQEAIDRCAVLGGGEVVVPAGSYLSGAIALRSDVMLRLEKDASIIGTPDIADYPVTQVRWEGKWIPGRIGLIYAIDAVNTGIIGPGSIMGNHTLGGRPSAENPLRRPALIEPINCKNIRFEDFSTDYHLMWSLHPTYCENVFIKNLTIRSTGGNGDGIDIDSCRHVRIDGCDIATGDDCIAIKSGRGMEGYTLMWTTEDVHISNCTLADSIFACIGIGSETSGGIRDVRIENCRFTYAKTHAIYIKSRPGRGASIENITARNLDISGMEGGFLRFNLLGSGIQDPVPVPGKEGIPDLKNFSFSDIRVNNVPVLVDGTSIHPDKPLNGFLLENVSGTCQKGIFLANIRNTKIKNIQVKDYSGSLLNCSNVTGKGIVGAAKTEPPKLPAPIPQPEKPFRLG